MYYSYYGAVAVTKIGKTVNGKCNQIKNNPSVQWTVKVSIPPLWMLIVSSCAIFIKNTKTRVKLSPTLFLSTSKRLNWTSLWIFLFMSVTWTYFLSILWSYLSTSYSERNHLSFYLLPRLTLIPHCVWSAQHVLSCCRGIWPELYDWQPAWHQPSLGYIFSNPSIHMP